MIRVFVEASDAVNLPGESAVFVYARALEGPPMPLAVQRMRLADLPATVVLNESMAMMAGMSLANFDKVVVIARVSRTGVVAPSAGDFEARTGSIDLTSPVPLLKLSVSERLAGPD